MTLPSNLFDSVSQARQNLNDHSPEELDLHDHIKTEDFTDWCNDFAIFYSLRLVLFKRPIVIEIFPQNTEPFCSVLLIGSVFRVKILITIVRLNKTSLTE